MNIRAFGRDLPLEQQIEHVLRAYPAHCGEDITNILRAALVTIETQKAWIGQMDAKMDQLLDKLAGLERAREERQLWLVKGMITRTDYMVDKPKKWEESMIIEAPDVSTAEKKFIQHWQDKDRDYDVSYWVDVQSVSKQA